MSSKVNLSKLAWRNVWRNRRRTLITLVGIAFGFLLSVLATGLGDSSYADMIDYGAKAGAGHVGIQHEDYSLTPSVKKSVKDVEGLKERGLALPGVTLATERITGAVMLATASNSTGAFFVAFDPEVETDQSLVFLPHIRDGELFAPDDNGGVVIGATLAENLDVKVGKKVVLTLTDKSGEIVTHLVRVRGIVRTGADSVDAGLCLLPISAARELLGYDADEATLVALFLEDNRASEVVAAQVRTGLPAGVAALTWSELQPDLAGMIQMKQGSTWVLEVIIMALLAAGIFNTMFVSVMERLREFGILRALGFSPGQLFGLVMWECLWLAAVGLALSFVVTAWPYYNLSTQGLDYSQMLQGGTEVAGVAMLEPILYVHIYLEHLLQICALVVGATLAAGIYPAWRAGRVPPADAIRLN